MKDSVKNFSTETFPYLVRTEYRITKEATATNKEGKLVGWTATRFFVMIDRRNGNVLSETNARVRKKIWSELLEPINSF